MLVPGDSPSNTRGFVCLQEALTCASNRNLHPLMRSRYVKLILNMFVKVGKNWSFLDHLCYSFVSELYEQNFVTVMFSLLFDYRSMMSWLIVHIATVLEYKTQL